LPLAHALVRACRHWSVSGKELSQYVFLRAAHVLSLSAPKRRKFISSRACGGWTGRGCQGSFSQRVGGRELTPWGEGVEEVLKRASRAFPSADDELTLCAEALPFVPQSLVVGGSSGRGALARALSGNGGGAPGEAKQRPRPYLVSAAGGCCCRDLGG
jgi:hypothetical protein